MRSNFNQDSRFKSLNMSIDEEEAPIRKANLPMQVTQYEKKFLEWLVNMHNSLRADTVEIDNVKSLAEQLNHMKQESSDDYLNALLKPEYSKGSKIPSTIPVPTSSFQLHNSITVAPNASGNAAIMFNPFYLAASGTNSTLYVNNNAALTGQASSNFFTAASIGQVIPAVYNEYRLVSASIVVKYIGRLDIVQGVIGGAIVFDQNVNDIASGTVNANLAKYGDFNLAMDSFYTQENYTLNGLRELYFPLDPTFEQYYNITTSKTGFSFLIYIQDGVPSSLNYKIDIYCNYECLPDATFLNYIPTSLGDRGSQMQKEEAIKFVQNSPITTADEGRLRPTATSFWEKIKTGLGAVLPSVVNLTSSLFPQLKMLAPIAQAAASKFLTPQNQYQGRGTLEGNKESKAGNPNESWLSAGIGGDSFYK